MSEYIRPIDERFQINGISMPRPHTFKTNVKWNNLDAARDINTGTLILNPINRIIMTNWSYKLLIDTQYHLIYNQVFQSLKQNYKKSFKSLNSNTFNIISYETYEPDNFQSPAVAFVRDGHRYFKDISFDFTSVGEVIGI